LYQIGLIFLFAFLALTSPEFAATQSPTLISAAGSRAGSTASTMAPAARPSVVLADLDNRTQDALFDHSLTQALVLEINQSPFLSAPSERRVADALLALGRPISEPITASVGRQVCLRTGSQLVLDGVIALEENHYEIDLEAVDCNTGATVADERAQAGSKKDVLKALDSVSANLRLQLGEPESSVRKFSVPAEATTASLEALDDYSLGLAARRDGGDVPSIPFFERALTHDPSFSMAKAVLAVIYGNLRQPTVAVRYATAAYELRNRLGERERLHVSGVYFLETGQMAKEIRNYELWRRIYPGDAVPYNNLGNDYAALGQLTKALWDYSEALRLTPNVVGYTNVAGMELALNRFDDAGSTLDEAFAHQLDGRYLHQTLYWLSFLRGDALQMDRQVAWAAGKAGDEDPLLSMQSDTEAYYGRLSNARKVTLRAVESAVHAGSKEAAALWQVNDALREAEVGSVALAREGVASALALSRGRDVELMAAFALARAGDSAGAAELVHTVEKQYPNDSLLKLYWLPTILSAAKLDAGSGSAACRELRKVLPYELGGAGTFINYIYPAYVRGEAYLRVGNAHAAGMEFQKLLDHRGIVVNFVTGALVQLQLGRAYAMAGDTSKARAAYQAFFSLWEGADSDVPILLQARAEYSRL